jgi:hypothetical protein
VRFVKNDGLGAGQEFDEAFFFKCEVRQQQVMIDDDEVGFLGRSAAS